MPPRSRQNFRSNRALQYMNPPDDREITYLSGIARCEVDEHAVDNYRGAGHEFVDPRFYSLSGEEIRNLSDHGVDVIEKIIETEQTIEAGPEMIAGEAKELEFWTRVIENKGEYTPEDLPPNLSNIVYVATVGGHAMAQIIRSSGTVAEASRELELDTEER